MNKCLLGFLLCCCLIGCGQTGPLYLPTQPTDTGNKNYSILE